MQRPYRQELKVRKKVMQHFERQHRFVVNTWRDLYDDVFLWYYSTYGKSYNRQQSKALVQKFNSMEEYREKMELDTMVEDIKPDIEKAIVIGYKQSYNTHARELDKVGISFKLKNPLVEEYMNEFEDLQLSDYRGSISWTTKNRVIRELRKGVKEWLSYTEIWTNIQNLDKSLFNKARASLIAANETGKAFEVWNYIPMLEAEKAGAKVTKQWLTVHDDRVTEECRANENMGWIQLSLPYPSSDAIAPRKANPSCRCTMQYYMTYDLPWE